jgi:hypothetical protein
MTRHPPLEGCRILIKRVYYVNYPILKTIPLCPDYHVPRLARFHKFDETQT